MRRNVWLLVGVLVAVLGSFAAVLATDTRPILGLDLQGGVSVVLAPVGKASNDSVDKAVDIIRNRVDALGVAEPEISRQGHNVVIDLPGVKEREKAQRLVGRTAELRFRPVLTCLPKEGAKLPTPTTSAPAGGATTSTTAAPTSTTVAPSGSPGRSRPTGRPGTPPTTSAPTSTPSTTSPSEGTPPTTAAPSAVNPPTTPPAEDHRASPVVLEGIPGKDGCVPGAPRYYLGPTAFTGKGVKTASAQYQPGQGWSVALELNSKGLADINRMATELFPKPPPQNRMAIVLDSVVQSAPAFQTSTFDSRGVSITGDFSQTEAEDLATVLRYGALPVQLKPLTTQSISPSLGSDQLRSGLIAGALGIALVALYMLFYYRILGLVVWFGMALSGLAVYSLVAWLGESVGLTLTLAGVTGLIVSVGITVDSYVVYFERLKDEVRSGRTIRSSVDRAFTSSIRTIVAADLVSLIGAAILYYLAIGSVRGFAFFLGVSTALDLALSFFFMHPLVFLMSRRPRLLQARWFGIASGLDVADTTEKKA